MNVLILSIGSNPLPNYIVANYLKHVKRDDTPQMPVPDKIIFVYSSKTENFKKRIVEKLNIGDNISVGINLGDKIREFDEIKKRVFNKLTEFENIEAIHLNYTGGTKPMAVGISATVEEFKNCKTKIYSDLSPDELRLTLRNGEKYPLPDNISEKMNISIEDLYFLHDLEPKKIKLKREHSDFYSDKFRKFLFEKVTNDKRGDKDFYKLWNTESRKKDKKQDKEKLLNSIKEVFNEKLDKMKDLIKFVCGTWLEEYLFDVLSELKTEGDITDLAWNVEAKVKERNFELDVIVMKGIQSFVFTCTTAYKTGICKGKAFEGIYRSEQIGGEHSKTILVCMADNFDKNGNESSNKDDKVIENIKNDMSQFDAINNFSILGSEEIKNREIFKENLIEILNGDN